MRILHIGKYASTFCGGIERFVYQLAEVQKAQGHVVKVFAAGDDEHPCTVSTTMYGRFASVPVTPLMWRDFSRVLAEHTPDVVHVHMPTMLALPLLCECSGWNGRIVVHWHADVATEQMSKLFRLLYPIYRQYESRLLNKATCIIATSHAYKNASTALAPHMEKVRVIPLSIVVRRDFNQSASLQKKRSALPLSIRESLADHMILCVGRHVAYKGFDDAITAAQWFTDDTTLVLAGAGEESSRLRKLAEKVGVQKRVQFLGQVDDALLAKLFAAADICCIPSRNRYEAFGLVALEAMRAGVPVAAADIDGSGLPELVRTNDTGWTFPPDAPQGLAACINLMLKNNEARARMSQNGKHAVPRYAIENIARVIERMYE